MTCNVKCTCTIRNFYDDSITYFMLMVYEPQVVNNVIEMSYADAVYHAQKSRPKLFSMITSNLSSYQPVSPATVQC